MDEPPPTQAPDWGPLYVQYADRLWRVARTTLRRHGGAAIHDRAAEVVSQAFVELMERPPVEHPANWEAFLIRVVTCRAIDLLRKEHLDRREAFPEADAQAGSVVDGTQLVIERLAVDQLLDQLDQRSRYVLEQVIMLKRPAQEVAAELGLSPGRVSQLKTEALKQLQLELAQEREEPWR